MGLGHCGHFPKAAGNKRHLLVGMDYFIKWVEAEPLANIRDVDAKRFIWKNIVTRFGIPHTLISDNGLQFDSKAFRRYCCDLGIKNRYSTPAYPQGNGQAEAINKVIVSGLKKRLATQKGNGWKSCHMSFGHTGLFLVGPLGRHPFRWLIGPRLLFL